MIEPEKTRKISIITVAFNSASTIRDTLESVLFQTFTNIEYLVVDGASTDDTIEIIKAYEPKFDGRMRWISEPDSGLYDAMNKGIRMATGDIIGFLNSDDKFCDENTMEKVMSCFEKNDSAEAVYADLFYVSQNDTDKIVRRWTTGERRSFGSGWHPAHPTLYIKQLVYRKYGQFDLRFKLAADFEIMLRFIERYQIKLYYLKEPLVKMRLGGKTNQSIKNIVRQNIECLKAFRVNGLKVNKWMYPFLRILPKLTQFTR